MADMIAVPEGAQLSQVERVVDTFVAPSKTFTDILRSAQCWLPLVLFALVSIFYSYAIDKKVGWEAVTETQIAKSQMQSDAMAQLPPDQRAQRIALQSKITKSIAYSGIVMALIFIALEALVLWVVFAFILGGKPTYPQTFAVVSFAALPRIVMSILAAVLVFAGVGTENFDIQNPVGTNVGYYLSNGPKWAATAGSFIDIFGIWALILLAIGMATISKKKTSTSAAVIFGLWFICLLLMTGVSAAFS